MNTTIVGNLCSLCALGTDSLSSTRKTTKGILLSQTASQIFYGTGVIILGGYSAAVQNGVSVIRNVLALSKNKARWIEWLLIVIAVGLGIIFNNLGTLGWLPIIANLEYTLAVFYLKKKEKFLKFAFAINVAMFCVFNFTIKNYVSVAANIFVFVLTIVYLFKGKKDGKDECDADD